MVKSERPKVKGMDLPRKEKQDECVSGLDVREHSSEVGMHEDIDKNIDGDVS